MKYGLFLLTTIIYTGSGYSQDLLFNSAFGNFRNACSFHITSAGFIYVSDTGSDEVQKFDTLGNLIKEIGGYGWDEELFDDPVDVFATPLNVYVSDKNNHRIQRFDKDLNFISQLSARDNASSDEQFGYPLGCVTSSQGDLFILDSENKRIIKFDLFGNFIQNFGSYEAGDYTLSSPKRLAISPGNNIYVIDKNDIKIFDQFGNGIGIVNAEVLPEDITIVFSSLVLSSRSEIFSADLRSPELSFNKIFSADDQERNIGRILSALIFGNKLYILTPKEILVYTR